MGASMTALVSTFSRAYHAENNRVKVFDDTLAKELLSAEEYAGISKQMGQGIAFFNPEFKGEESAALRWIVDNQLSPAPLGRAAFAEGALRAAVKEGARQYLIFGAGYDTFAYRQPEWAKTLEIFELDQAETGQDKQLRLKRAGIEAPKNVHYIHVDLVDKGWINTFLGCSALDMGESSFCSMLGLSYYLSSDAFSSMLGELGAKLRAGSRIALDYPDEDSYTERAKPRASKQAMLAGGANEHMLASYSLAEMEKLLNLNGFRVVEQLTPEDMTERYFKEYNRAEPAHRMTAFDNVNCCLAVKL